MERLEEVAAMVAAEQEGGWGCLLSAQLTVSLTHSSRRDREKVGQTIAFFFFFFFNSIWLNSSTWLMWGCQERQWDAQMRANEMDALMADTHPSKTTVVWQAAPESLDCLKIHLPQIFFTHTWLKVALYNWLLFLQLQPEVKWKVLMQGDNKELKF